MSFSKRILALFVALICLASSLSVAMPASASDGGAAEEQTYTRKKVVSVLYDTSSSMGDDVKIPDPANPGSTIKIGKPYQYARYAMQSLITLLNDGDELYVTPMHGSGTNVVNESNYNDPDVIMHFEYGEGFDRNAAIEAALSHPMLADKPVGSRGTPASPIQWAIKHLVDEGMKTHAEVSVDTASDTDYFLIVMTDGDFQAANINGVTLDDADLVEHYVRPSSYADFQCFYFGFTADSKDFSTSLFDRNNENVFSFRAEDAAEIATEMQKVASKITGRYSVKPADISYAGNTVTVSLENEKYALRSMTMLLQNSDARLTGAAYNGQSVFDDSSSLVSFAGEPAIKAAGGSSAVFHPIGSTFERGTLTLTFADNLTASDIAGLSLLLEPALEIVPTVTHDGKNIPITEINQNLEKGDVVTISYFIRVIGTDTVMNPGEIADSEAVIKYNNEEYKITKDRPSVDVALVEGELPLTISVSILGGEYVFYNYILFRIMAHKDDFDLLPDGPYIDPMAVHKSETRFTVKYNGEPVALSGVNENRFRFEIKAFSGEKEIRDYTYAIKDGKLVVSMDTSAYEYGVFSIDVKVFDTSNNYRPAHVDVPYYPGNLAITPIQGDTISLSMYQLAQNAERGVALRFKLSAGEETLSFTNSVFSAYYATITYQLNGETRTVDVKGACTIEGDTLTFLPTPETLGDFAKQAGEGKLVIKIDSKTAPHINTESAPAAITLKDTTFTVVPLGKGEVKVDRFGLRDNQSMLYFAVYRDTVERLTQAELEAALADGSLYVDPTSYGTSGFSRFFTPLTCEASYQTVDGEPAIGVLVTTDQAWVPEFFTSMLISGGERNLLLCYADAEAPGEETYTVLNANIAVYILRIVILIICIILIVRGIFLLIGLKSCGRFPHGTLVQVTVSLEPDGYATKGKITQVSSGLQHFRSFKDSMMPERTFGKCGKQNKKVEFKYICAEGDDPHVTLNIAESSGSYYVFPMNLHDATTKKIWNELKNGVHKSYDSDASSFKGNKMPDENVQWRAKPVKLIPSQRDPDMAEGTIYVRNLPENAEKRTSKFSVTGYMFIKR